MAMGREHTWQGALGSHEGMLYLTKTKMMTALTKVQITLDVICTYTVYLRLCLRLRQLQAARHELAGGGGLRHENVD